MKTLMVYGSRKRLTTRHQSVDKKHLIWLRVRLIEGEPPAIALAKFKRHPGEFFLGAMRM